MTAADFVHLRVRSAFSLLEGAITHKGLADACAKHGMPAVAVTDHANLFGVMPFCSAAIGKGVQPIVGALLPLRQESPTRPGQPPKHVPPPLMPVLVQNEAGYGNLMALLSRAYLDSDQSQDIVCELDDLLTHNEGLILLSGGPDGPIGRHVQRQDVDAARALAEQLKGAFGDRLYVELQRHGETAERQTEEAFVDLAYDLNLALVATNDVHFAESEMQEPHDALICIAEGVQIAQPDRRHFTSEYRLKSPAEMRLLFADLPEAIEQTVVIAQRCGFAAPARKPILPPFDSGVGRDEEEELRHQAREGLDSRLAQHVFDEKMDAAERAAAAKPYKERLEFELDVIVKMQFPGYFLIVSDFIKWAKSRNIPVGPGRGSGAGSVVAWSLAITDLDPLRFGLLFERFLNPERVSMPDFDIDFCMNRRDEVIGYVQEKYGRDKVAAIITFGKLQARAALRDVGRVLGLPFGLVDRISKMVPFNPANPPTLEQALAMEPRLQQARKEEEGVARMIEIALALEGLPRHASTHAAGVVIGDRPLAELVPLYRDPRSSMPVTQFNMKDVEKAGLVKFDFLGLSTLTMLRWAEEFVRAGGTDLDLSTLELDDKDSYALLSRAETTGVFQLESGGMRDALRKLKPDCFEDIIAMVSLYRPGPMDNIPRYIEVKHGREDPAYMHPMLEPILRETNGVIIYQEQVMEIAKQLAGYTLGGADLLRRAMGKKIKAEMDSQREIFVEGCGKNDIEPDLANAIFDGVAKFASYGFNKSHAAAYALLAYHTAYLKANHPVEFYAAVMTMEMGNQEKLAGYRQEMQRREIALLPPDVNSSVVLFSVEDHEGKPAVRYALAAIKGVGQQAMTELVAERQTNGPFEDICALVRRVGPKTINRRILEGLIKAGALDGVDGNRQRSFQSIDGALRYAAAALDEAESSQEMLFGGTFAEPPRPQPPQTRDWPQLERLGYEFDAVGFYFSAHPLDGYSSVLPGLGVQPAAQIIDPERTVEGRPVRLAGVVTAKQEKKTERSRFAFLTLSDASAKCEVMIFSDLLEATRDLMEVGEALLVTADARVDNGEVKLTGHAIERLADRTRTAASAVEIEFDDPSAFDDVRDLLTTGQPGAQVRIVLPASANDEVVIALPRTMALPYTSRGDLGGIAGIRCVRELDRSAV